MIARFFTSRPILAMSAAVVAWLISVSPVLRAQEGQPTFRASVAVVPITAVVRDARNRLVRELRHDDFQVFEGDQLRRVIDFSATDRGPVSLGVLFDTSGSMWGPNLRHGKVIVNSLLDQLDHESDELALFTFDKAIRHRTPFTTNRHDIREALERVEGWGLTSLYDAIADTARQVAERRAQRRAVIVVTDGVDTSSAMSSAEVSGLASAIDIPVYILRISPTAQEDALSDLALWTGGDLRHMAAIEEAGAAVTSLMAELRQQYFLAIESAADGDWNRITVRTRRKGLSVRARSGYFATPVAQPGTPDEQH